MPWPKGRDRNDERKGPTRRPSPVSVDIYERFVSYAIGAGETIRDAMEAAMLAYMDGREVLSKDEGIADTQEGSQ